MHKVLPNYSSCTCKSNENVCNTEVKEKWKTRWNSVYHKKSMVFQVCLPSPLNVNVFILQIKKIIQPVNDQTECSEASVFSV